MESVHVPSYSHSEGADTATSNPEQIYPQRESSSYKLKMILNDFWHAILVHVLQIWDTKPPILQRFFSRWICFGGLALIERLQETASQAALEQHLGPWHSHSNTPEPLSAMEDKQFWWANKAMTMPWIWYPNWNKRVKLFGMLWIFRAMSSYTCASQVLGPWGVTVRRCWKRRFAYLAAVEWFLWSWFHGFRPVLPFCGFFWVLFRQLDWVGAELPACLWPARHLEIRSGLDNRGANKTRRCWMTSRHFHRS